ncbi:MAG TPA: hypothetical protein VFN51_00420 [Candidatus Saccharimonadales bacterium]|nr:hypothetical protein [Candidatus Saccharimonadales bacterium]
MDPNNDRQQYDQETNTVRDRQNIISDYRNFQYLSDKTSNKKHFALIIFVLVIIIGLFAVLAIQSLRHKQVSNNHAIVLKQATVDITSGGFVPADLTIQPGTEVTWLNQTSGVVAVGASPFPSHSSLPGLFSSQLGQKQSYSFIFNTTGNWQYQNDMNPLTHGTVVVKD